ncbi:MAG: hypothetical protein HND44_15050 [Chloroflexi bacterium]|nr:hypothetical protein [Ardenticatenaceae bacterium]MBL1129780.1 hypothetical protein [Chloroflexota bacterium]NOG35864.1 hypothetical protein [Chloroflexota bacterium]GIK55485.1 MAG: hypothetical protein BroJett015_11480 [Chloroflexota bacterium]
MKVIEETDSLLVLRQRPVVLYLLGLFLLGASVWALWTQVIAVGVWHGRLLGVILFLAGMGTAVLLLAVSTTATFDKTVGTVTVRRHSVLRQTEQTHPLSTIQQVTVGLGRAYDPSDRLVSRTHHLLLVLDRGRIVQLAGGGKIQISRLVGTAVRIREFLK